MGSLAESVREQPAMPRFEDGSVNPMELMRRLAEDAANAIMDAEADRLRAGGANGRNGYRERNLVTCVSQHDDRGADAPLGEDRGDCSSAVSFENGETLSANAHLDSNKPGELEIVRRQLGNNSIRHMIRTSLEGFGWSMADDTPAACQPFLTCRSSFLASLVEYLVAMTKEADCGGWRVGHRYAQAQLSADMATL